MQLVNLVLLLQQLLPQCALRLAEHALAEKFDPPLVASQADRQVPGPMRRYFWLTPAGYDVAAAVLATARHRARPWSETKAEKALMDLMDGRRSGLPEPGALAFFLAREGWVQELDEPGVKEVWQLTRGGARVGRVMVPLNKTYIDWAGCYADALRMTARVLGCTLGELIERVAQ